MKYFLALAIIAICCLSPFASAIFIPVVTSSTHSENYGQSSSWRDSPFDIRNATPLTDEREYYVVDSYWFINTRNFNEMVHKIVFINYYGDMQTLNGNLWEDYMGVGPKIGDIIVRHDEPHILGGTTTTYTLKNR